MDCVLQAMQLEQITDVNGRIRTILLTPDNKEDLKCNKMTE